MTEIFVVTALHASPKRRINWGWYSTLDEAINSVKTNHTDLFERGWYSHAAVFKLPEGLCTGAFNKDAIYFRGKFTKDGTFIEAKQLSKFPKFMEYYFLSL